METGKLPDARFPCVYVGQSWYPPEIRFAQHQAGIRAARCVKNFGVQLVPALYEHLPEIASKKEALAAERQLAISLGELGYTVRGGH